MVSAFEYSAYTSEIPMLGPFQENEHTMSPEGMKLKGKICELVSETLNCNEGVPKIMEKHFPELKGRYESYMQQIAEKKLEKAQTLATEQNIDISAAITTVAKDAVQEIESAYPRTAMAKSNTEVRTL